MSKSTARDGAARRTRKLASSGSKSIWRLLRRAALAWINSDVFRLSASLSYFTIFSLAPLLIIILFVVGLFWSGQAGGAQERILLQVRDLTGESGADMVRTMLENAERPGSGGLVATLFGVGALLFGATAVFVQLKGALNTVWDIEPKPLGVKGFLVSRVLSFGLVIAVGFLLLVSLVVSAALAAADEFFVGLSPGLHVVARTLNVAVSFGVITVLFAMIYRYLPDKEIAWRDVWVGAMMTAFLFSLGKFVISLYLGNSGVTTTYGAAGSLAILLLWVYYSSLIVFFGAELTQAYVQLYGSEHAAAHPLTKELEATAIPDRSRRHSRRIRAAFVMLGLVLGLRLRRRA